MITLLVALLTKHFIVDFLMQPPWMYRNKGTIYHYGGWVHAGFHGIVTAAILLHFTDPVTAAKLGFLEANAHYIIDYGKVNINQAFNWKADNSEFFWMMVGLDQFMHQLCYVLILLAVYP